MKNRDLHANILGLLELLLSAEISLQACCPDAQCQNILARCISEFRSRHKILNSDYFSRIAWTEQSDAALVRLLVYARAEAADAIKDDQCAEALSECISRIMKIRGLSSEFIFSEHTAGRGG
jgi:hypothetical protein